MSGTRYQLQCPSFAQLVKVFDVGVTPLKFIVILGLDLVNNNSDGCLATVFIYNGQNKDSMKAADDVAEMCKRTVSVHLN